MRLLSFATLALVAAAVPAMGQSSPNACRGRVSVDSVYHTGLGNNSYEYFIQIRNTAREPVMADVAFTNFPANVQVFSPRMPAVPLEGFQTRVIRFGKGTSAGINAGTVRTYYDVLAATSQPTVSVLNCRQR